MQNQNNKNLLLATSLSVIILIGWTWFYEKPKIDKIAYEQQQSKLNNNSSNSAENSQENPNINSSQNNNLSSLNKNEDSKPAILKDREESINKTQSQRIKIISDNLHGSINLLGARFDDLTLAKFFEKPNKEKEVILFSPSDSKNRYFSDFGFISSNQNITTPNSETLWSVDNKELKPSSPITLSWLNPQNIEFKIKISLNEDYLFTIEQSVINKSNDPISIASFGRINRIITDQQKPVYILHEGAIGAFNGILSESTYEDLNEEKSQKFNDKGNNGSWLGITDKYWLSSIIPDSKMPFEANFNYNQKNQNNLYGAEFISQESIIEPNNEIKFAHHLFAGAKKVKILDKYNKELKLKLFDRAIDFGWFYFLTKPFFFIIEFLYKIFGNFGLAILGMTVIVKLALFPMANKSYSAIGKLKKIQPKIDALRERFKDDKIAFNREMMEFYKKEKINPASGCLPILIQIPVFFALYKVFYVTLDMRHAPFYGWIKDLSAPDPTTIFNLFGLIPIEISSTLNIGIWPILMGITMIIQQKLSPPPSDPIQAKILKFMPYILTAVLSTFPAGLVIYWTWSNVLSILQQLYINNKLKKDS
jgi:YidC/Oxa1 family membrane protein insertase